MKTAPCPRDLWFNAHPYWWLATHNHKCLSPCRMKMKMPQYSSPKDLLTLISYNYIHTMVWRHTMPSFGVMTSCDVMVWHHTMPSCGVMWRHDVTSWHHVTSRCDVIWHLMSWHWVIMGQPIRSLKNPRFSTRRPWTLTLTFELIRDIIKVHTSTKF